MVTVFRTDDPVWDYSRACVEQAKLSGHVRCCICGEEITGDHCYITNKYDRAHSAMCESCGENLTRRVRELKWDEDLILAVEDLLEGSWGETPMEERTDI